MPSALQGDAVATVEDRIKTLWVAAGQPRTPIHWDNAPFTPPNTGQWIEVSVLFGEGVELTKNGANTITGVVMVNVFGAAGTGMGPLWALADHVRDLLNRLEIAPLRVGVASGPRRVTGALPQLNVRVPFEVEETVA